ncbi:MAG: hypothetical protein PHV05_08505, partial [Candidatus Riflebacteria bacterium]|nr:hypothetical protein [Candidatus Riflebacteria bacterium]
MFAKSLRGSVFVAFMLIVSMTLSGCSFDIGSLLGGLTNVIGKVGQGLGSFISKGVDVAKDFIGKAKDFVQPIIEKGKEVFDKVEPIAEKITDGVDKVKGVLDDVGNVGNEITDFGNKMIEGGTDAVGTKIDTTAPTTEVVADPDNEDSVITIKPADNAAAAPFVCPKVLAAEEREAACKKVTESVSQISGAVNSLSECIAKFNVPAAEKKDTDAQIASIKANIAKILKDPTSKESQALLKKTQEDAKKLSST